MHGLKFDILLQKVLEAVCAAAPTFRDVAEDVHDGNEDLTPTISQQGGGLDVVHLSNFMMQLDKAGGGLSAGDGIEALFHNSAIIGLGKEVSWIIQLRDNALGSERTDGS